MGLGGWPRAELLCPVWVKVRPSGSCQSHISHSCDRCGNHFRQKSRGVHPQEVKTQKPGRGRRRAWSSPAALAQAEGTQNSPTARPALFKPARAATRLMLTRTHPGLLSPSEPPCWPLAHLFPGAGSTPNLVPQIGHELGKNPWPRGCIIITRRPTCPQMLPVRATPDCRGSKSNPPATMQP